MSLVAVSLLGGGALWSLTRHQDFANYRKQKVDQRKVGVMGIGQELLSTGQYGDISDISNLINQPGNVKGVIHDVDLTGVPYRWLILQNGCRYKTYDTETKYC